MRPRSADSAVQRSAARANHPGLGVIGEPPPWSRRDLRRGRWAGARVAPRGFDHHVAVEYDEDAAATLAANLDPAARAQDSQQRRVVLGDVTDPVVWTPKKFVGVDLLAGGPPCPPFSDAGRRLGAADERDLFAWSIGLVARIRPRAVLLENVRGLSRPRFGGYRQAVVDRLAGLGYVTDWRIIHAHDHGVPQSRPRYVLVALSRENSAYFHRPDPQAPRLPLGRRSGS